MAKKGIMWMTEKNGIAYDDTYNKAVLLLLLEVITVSH